MTGRSAVVDKYSRWGIFAQFVGYSLLWQGQFWLRRPTLMQSFVASCFLLVAVLIAWFAAASLGANLRIDAALGRDHDLVCSGPYAEVRHPIYLSMLLLLIGTGLLFSTAPYMVPALAIFVAGTEIRIASEERLLASRFGETYRNYRKSTWAYIPFLH